MKRLDPMFSIAIPVRNGAHYLRAALDSALQQSYDDFEICISENASSDETLSILNEYVQKDKRVRFSRTEKLIPMGDNWNRVCRMAHGRWIKMLAHDDLLRGDCLEKIVMELGALTESERKQVGLIGTGEDKLFGNVERRGLSLKNGDSVLLLRKRYIVALIRGESKIPLPGIVTATLSNRVFQEGHAYDNRFGHLDIFLYMKLCCHYDYLYIPANLCVNRVQNDSVTATQLKGSKSVYEWRIFGREFLATEGRILNLGWWGELRLQLKTVGDAAAKVATYGLICADIKPAWGAITAVPLWQMPLLPVLIFRSWVRARRLVKTLQLPGKIIFP
ncbi:glycosyltransferase family 2 protein [Sneathiella sp.]|uniref:glycosyltransferase family 2 protein n=1 Tax=Sneathiella sp. TaxID=1964365 RepID=UPI0035629880